MDRKDYPLIMTYKEVMEIMGCSKRVAYEIMERKDFPLIRIGRTKKVEREDFFNWLDKHKVS